RGNPADGRCSWTIGSICRDDPFDSLCGGGYNNARETACRNGSNNTQCGNVIAGVCSGNPFDPLCGSGYTQNRRNACSGNPFATRCAGDVYNDLRVSFCTRNAGNHPSCPTQVTAKVWADSFDEDLAHGATAEDTKSQFLIGRATDLDTGGVTPFSWDNTNQQGNLNLADATFNGVALGGDATDGVAYFASGVGEEYSYAGILSGTNLGAPLTQRQGTAKWIGSFITELSSPTDFVLNISFGTGEGAGEIEALVQRSYASSSYYPQADDSVEILLIHENDLDHHITGEFDDAGVITGTARQGFYRANDPNNRRSTWEKTGALTGLIGEEGAVGAFIIDNYYGGFVARPSSAEDLRTLEQTCVDDPFNKRCSIGYEAERDAIFDRCIIGGNANDESCVSAKEWHYCITNPFSSSCSSSFSKHYEQARINRLAFCRTAGNTDNALCTIGTIFARICTNHPFDAQCRGDNDYRSIRRTACTDNPFAPRCTGDAYNDLRVTFCENNADNPACPQPPQATAEVWEADIAAKLANTDDENDIRSKFVVFTPEEDVAIEGVAQLDDTFQTLKIRNVGGVAFLSFTRNDELP
ncbi:MAG: hypothetical protein K8953_04665, partial [Proteobacteria bacterium]|nr:hypothetical protein [Pseudomonadota bacterium]